MIRPLHFLFAFPLLSAFADTIQLKSGEIIEARIVAQDKESITVEVQFSPTIVDQRVIAREEIAHFAVDSGDEAAFRKIRDITTPDTVLDPAKCEALIREKLQPFLVKFPKSPRVDDVRKQIEALRADIARLQSGEVRVAGAWHDPASVVAEKYQIEAAAQLEAARKRYGAKDYVAAMNSFDDLMRRQPESVAFAEGAPLALDCVTKLRQQLTLNIENLPEEQARRKAAIDRTPIEQRQPIEQAVAAEDATALAAADLARKNQQRFHTIFPFDEKGLKAMQTTARQIEKQLRERDMKQLEKNARLVRQANAELSKNHLAAAETTLGQLKASWPRYEALPRMEQRLAAALAAREAAAAAAAEKAKTSP